MSNPHNNPAHIEQAKINSESQKGAARENRASLKGTPEEYDRSDTGTDQAEGKTLDDLLTNWSASQDEWGGTGTAGRTFDFKADKAKCDAAHGYLTIDVVAGELPRTASRTEQALIGTGTPFYIRDDLMRPVFAELPGWHGRTVVTPSLIPVTEPMLLDHAMRSATFRKYDGRAKASVTINPPKSIAATILSRKGEWRFRPLAGLITTPTLRPDGTILAEPGYDAATRLLLLSPPAVPPIADNPTRADAENALATLEALLVDFTFTDDAARAVALSGLITPIVRGAFPTAPAHVVNAPAPGSGKSYLIDLAAAIATGERAPVIAIGRTEEETEKRLGAALMAGRPIVAVDNVNGDFGGDFLCQAVERPIVNARVLGRSELKRIENRATFFANGNNIQIVGDMTRRALLCTLDPAVERPELRTFKADPLALVVENRGEYVAAALTIVRAFIVSGAADVKPALASFEGWNHYVRSALVWLGCSDPCDTMRAARAGDPVLTGLGQLLAAWRETVGDSYQLAGTIVREAERHDGIDWQRPHLRDALLEVAENKRGDGIDAKRLGKYLARYKGRIVDGLRLFSKLDEHSHQQLWRVATCGGCG